jgi:hypothetical protein
MRAAPCSRRRRIPCRSTTAISGGAGRRARAGASRSGPRAISPDGRCFPSCRWRTKTRRRTRAGRTSSSRRKRSSSSPRAAASPAGSTRGATSCGRTGATWPTPFRGTFPITTAAATAGSASRRWPRFRPIATASTTSPATCGSGAATGTAPTITRGWRRPWRGIRAAPTTASIRRSRAWRSACSAAARSSAPTSSARVISSAHAAAESRRRAPTISASAA